MNRDQKDFEKLSRTLGNINVDLSKEMASIDAGVDQWAANETSGNSGGKKGNFWDTFNNVLTTGNTALQTYQSRKAGVPAVTPPPSSGSNIPWVPIGIGAAVLVGAAVLLKSDK